ncbi:MAG: hypothetical protein AABX98_04410 [Nanoarchaeota archaeon]
MENDPHIGRSSLGFQTTGYDPLYIKLKKLFDVNDEARRQRVATKEFNNEYYWQTNTQEWSVAQNPNRQNDLDYITSIGDDKDNPMYAGIIQLEDCCKQRTSKKDYQQQRRGKQE